MRLKYHFMARAVETLDLSGDDLLQESSQVSSRIFVILLLRVLQLLLLRLLLLHPDSLHSRCTGMPARCCLPLGRCT